MKTLAVTLMLEAMLCLAAAPVPKHIMPPKPEKITKPLLVGRWEYQWSTMLGGWLEFNDDGTYTAQHDPGSDTIYSGTWTVDDAGKSITIVEWSHSINRGTSYGPQCYRFDVGMKGWPALDGKSTSGFGFDVQQIPEAHTHLKLSRSK